MRLSKLFASAALGLAAWAVCSFAADAGGPNLLINPGFEEAEQVNGLPKGWAVYPANYDRQKLQVAVDATQAHSGKASLKVEMAAKCTFVLTSAICEVNPGDTVNVSVFYKSDLKAPSTATDRQAELAGGVPSQEDANPVKLELAGRDRHEVCQTRDPIKGKASAADWEQLQGTFTVAEGIPYMQAFLISSNMTGRISCDDFVLRRMNSWSANLNPDSENGVLGRNRFACVIENLAQSKDPVKLELLLDGAPAATIPFAPTGAAKQQVACDYEIAAPGKHDVRLTISSPTDGTLIFAAGKKVLVPEKLSTSVVHPAHVWSDWNATRVTDSIGVMLPAAEAQGCSLAIEVQRDGVTVKKDAIANPQAVNEYAFPVAGLAQGKYRMVITLLDAAGKQVAQNVEEFQVMGRPRPKVAVKDGQLTIEGKPVFPIGMWSPGVDRYKEMAECGFNFVHNYAFDGNEAVPANSLRACLSVMDKAEEAGLWFCASMPVIEMMNRNWAAVGERVEAYKDHPALMCYLEEELMAAGDINLDGLKQWCELVRRIDPDRPIAFEDTEHGNPGKFPWELMDIGMALWYPFPLPKDATELIAPEAFTKNAAVPGKPIWMVPQSYLGQRAEKRFPTSAEYRVQTYLSIIQGAKGLMYYGGHIFKDPVEGNWEGLKRTVREMSELSPVLLDPAPAMKVEIAGSAKVSALLKKHDGKYYLLTANADAPQADVRFTLPFKAAKVSVKFENRAVTPEGNVIADAFGPYAVHVYEIIP